MLLLVALVQFNLYIQLASSAANVPPPGALPAAKLKRLLTGAARLAQVSPRTLQTGENETWQRPAAAARDNKLDYLFSLGGDLGTSWHSAANSSAASRADYVLTTANQAAADEPAAELHGPVEGAETFTNNHNQWPAGEPDKQHNSRHYNKFQPLSGDSSFSKHLGGARRQQQQQQHNHHHHHHLQHQLANSNNKFLGLYNSNAFANNYNFNYIQSLLGKPAAPPLGPANSLLLNAHMPNSLAPLSSAPGQQPGYAAENGFAPGPSALSGGTAALAQHLSATHVPAPTTANQDQDQDQDQGRDQDQDQDQGHNQQRQRQQWAGGGGGSIAAELPGASTCGRQQVPGHREPRVVGGNSTYEGEFPWAVSIQRHGNHHCGGVIVGRRWILTAAHCVRSQLVANLLVRTGGSTLARSANSLASHLEQDHLVEQIVLHDDFSRYDNLTAAQSKSSANTNNADIALLKLRRDIRLNELAWPVCFPSGNAGNFSGQEATVVGWGKLSEKSDDFSNQLQKVKLTIIDNRVCQNWFRQAGRDMPIDERIICAGFKGGGKDACHGDSGGPLLSRINGQYAVVGVVSTGIGCARPLLPGLYSRVSSYVGWIGRHVAD